MNGTCQTCGEPLGKKAAKGLCVRCYGKQYKRMYYAKPENVARRAERGAQYHAENKDRLNAQITQRRREQRAQVMTALGSECQCCGETTPVFLTIDHVQNDGAKDRGLHRHLMISRIIKEGIPRERYQILCWNCNSAKHLLGCCPHSI